MNASSSTGYMCTCATGYSGVDCAILPARDDDLATRDDDIRNWFPGYLDDDDDVDDDDYYYFDDDGLGACSEYPCEHLGKCTSVGSSGFECDCESPWSGSECTVAPYTVKSVTSLTGPGMSVETFDSVTFSMSIMYVTGLKGKSGLVQLSTPVAVASTSASAASVHSFSTLDVPTTHVTSSVSGVDVSYNLYFSKNEEAKTAAEQVDKAVTNGVLLSTMQALNPSAFAGVTTSIKESATVDNTFIGAASSLPLSSWVSLYVLPALLLVISFLV